MKGSGNMAIQAVNFKGENEKKKSGGATFPIVTTATGALIGGVIVGDKINAKSALTKDTFELKGKEISQTDKDAATAINKILESAKDDKVESIAQAKADIVFKKEEALKTDEYLQATKGKTAAEFEESIKAAEGETAGLEAKANEAATALEKADDTTREALTKAKTDADNAVTNHKAKIDADKAELEFSKNGVKKGDYKAKVLGEEKVNIAKSIDGELSKINAKLLKKKSGKMAIFGAIGGLVVGLIANAIFAPKKHEAPQA